MVSCWEPILAAPFHREGKQRWAAAIPGVAWDVNLTEDARYAVAALGDGTIRWYEAGTGAEVLALFVHKDGRRWVPWTPEGFYDASPGGESLFGYHLNQGADQAGEFVKVDQLRDLFYRADLIAKRLKSDGAETIQAALKNIPDIRTVLAGGLPPDLELLSPEQSQSPGELNLQFRVKNRGGGIGRVVYRVDGAEIEGRAPAVILPGSSVQNHRFDLSPGRHEVTATVYNSKNQVESRSISAIVNVAQATGVPSLYLVAAGISHYRDQALDVGVRYAADDAKAIVDRLTDQGRGLFDHVTPYPLDNNQATRMGIERSRQSGLSNQTVRCLRALPRGARNGVRREVLLRSLGRPLHQQRRSPAAEPRPGVAPQIAGPDPRQENAASFGHMRFGGILGRGARSFEPEGSHR